MKTTTAIVMSLATVAACAGKADVPVGSAPGPSVAPASLEDGHVTYGEFQEDADGVRDSLLRLDALQVLEVGQLIVDAPLGSHNCYGPCEDDDTAQAWMQEHAVQAARLAVLADAAEAVASDAPRASLDEVDAALSSLRGLEIVEIEGATEVGSNNCYACPTGEEASGVVVGLAKQTRGL